MSMAGWRHTRLGDSSVKITDAITLTGEDEIITKDIVVNKLAIVKFKWTAKKNNDKYEIEFFFSTSKQKSAKDCSVRINIASEDLTYVKKDIDVPENWSDWQQMGCLKVPRSNGTYVTLCDYYVNAFEVNMDKLGLKLHADTDFTDFHLATTEGTVAIHRARLASHREVFKNMLTGEWRETAEGKINIKGVSLQTLHHLKDYIYLGTVPDEGLCPLLLIARCYLIEDLQKHCIRKLAETVVPENLFSLMEFACANNIPELGYAMLEITQDSVITQAHNKRRSQPNVSNDNN